MNMTPKKRIVIGVLLVLLLAIAAWLVLIRRPLPVRIVQAEYQVPVKVFGLGTVEARVLSKIGFETGGTLVAIAVDQGDRVEQGDILARLHSVEQQARVDKAQASLVQAQAGLEKVEATLARARAILKQRQQTNRRQQTLVKQGTVSQEIADESQMNETVADADVVVAQSEVIVARAALADARAQLVLEQSILDNYVLPAPYDAVVVSRNKELGTVLSPGEPLFTLVDPATVWVLAHVDEAQAGELSIGQAAEVRLRSRPNQALAAHVARIDIESDRVSEERRVYVKCEQCPAQFHIGEQAEVLITVTVLEQALLVPETAVDLYDGQSGAIWTVVDGELQHQRVAFGQRMLDGRLAITGGLAAGSRVVAESLPAMRDGRAVTLLSGEQP
jgi:HlyD family secretion protein